MHTSLDFEGPIAELESKIDELRHLQGGDGLNIAEEVNRLQSKLEKILKATYSKLTPAQKVQVARHPSRPHFLDYAKELVEDFVLLAGDRRFADDRAICGGLGRFHGKPVMIMGHERGHDTETRVKHNFGMAKPEGYRKAQRLMRMAEKFELPVITLIDTAGAYPGVDAEERGQAEAIAKSIQTCLTLKTPIVSVVIGEGGSGGAIALAAADSVFMLENAVYSVISPEGCASILWRDAVNAAEAATALKLTAQDLKEFGVIDDIILEPLGGAHRNPKATIKSVGDIVARTITDLSNLDPKTLVTKRREKFLKIGHK